ncbi:uncharacterized protein BDW47DRAFT_105218 [Aspergillus candidus]|uniref:Uncharacterized protein n=1 Tax=Aspergillus candidus TaxID=41067 RepID=A0A2I2FCH4_ASPCN|nr:hypothetical protein BDW47DRAFT_105218 [Aspergillus candidus]PLB38328.1 hypothetical protein BDW47DRAFT_105218 [Aspergillus candidus]
MSANPALSIENLECISLFRQFAYLFSSNSGDVVRGRTHSAISSFKNSEARDNHAQPQYPQQPLRRGAKS